jgi:hypothetical protein
VGLHTLTAFLAALVDYPTQLTLSLLKPRYSDKRRAPLRWLKWVIALTDNKLTTYSKADSSKTHGH